MEWAFLGNTCMIAVGLFMLAESKRWTAIYELGAPILFCGLIVIQQTFSHWFNTAWFAGWIYSAALGVVIAGQWLRRQGSRAQLYAPILVYACVSGVAVGLGGYGYSNIGTTEWNGLKASGAEVHAAARLFSVSTLSMLTLFVIAILTITKEQTRVLRGTLSLLGLVTAVSVFAQWALGDKVTLQIKMFDNPSMGASFAILGLISLMGLTIERIHGRTKQVVVAFFGGTIGLLLFVVKASTPIAAAVAGVACLLKQDRRFKRFVAPLTYVSVLAVAVALIWFLAIGVHDDLVWESAVIKTSGRLEYWHKMYAYWSDNDWRMAWGTGLGTSKILLPLLTRYGLFWAHSDWLQIIFELGYLGFSQAILAFVRVYYGLRDHKALLPVLVAFAALMLTNFPLHSPAHALWAIVLIKESL